MNRYILIEKELMGANADKFQLICNAFLSHEYPGDLHCPGAVAGKEKTKKGIPDTFIIQQDGRYVLAEFTTQDRSLNYSAFIRKLKTDIQRCLALRDLKIKKEQIAAIVICCTAKVGIEEREALKQLVEPFNIPVRIVDIDILALYLFTRGRYFAHLHLGIPLDTGQILNKKEFLKQYSKANLATPLDIPIVDRQKERLSLVESLDKNDITIVSGPAGVGKSALSIQVIDNFLASNPSYSAFYLWHKSGSITEDLLAFLEENRNYIFFVDDANRQLNNLISLIYAYAETETIKIKIIITVREYAKEDVIKACTNYRPALFSLKKLGNNTISRIVSNVSGKIKNSLYQQRIVKISKGNPRLAIMAARLMQNTQDLSTLKDISTIYNEYFDSIMQDNHVLKDTNVLKALGLISYFYSFDLDSDSLKYKLLHFHIPYETFVDAVNELEKLEFVEVHGKYAVRIAEQNLATYFFYKTFIKDDLLSFDTLLNHYFANSYRRMKDIFDSTCSSFGEQRIIAIIKSGLIKYFYNIQEKELAIKFLRIFGKYLPEQTFSFIASSINNPQEKAENKMNEHFLGNHPFLQVIRQFFSVGNSREMLPAIELSILYLEKNQRLHEMICFLFSWEFDIKHEDISDNCDRQWILYNFLRNKLIEGDLYQKVFYTSFEKILLRKFKKNFYYVKNDGHLQPSIQLKNIRGRFWNDIGLNFQQHNYHCRLVLKNYVKSMRGINNSLLRFDQEHMCQVIQNHLDPLSAEDCYLVNEYTSTIELYQTLSNDMVQIRDKFPYAAHRVLKIFELNWKTDGVEIDQYLQIKSIKEFKEIYSWLIQIKPFYEKKEEIRLGLTRLLSATIRRNPQLGFNLLKFYLSEGNKLDLYTSYLYRVIFNTQGNLYKKVFKLINETVFDYSDKWKADYFAELKEEHASKSILNKMIDFFSTAKNVSIIYFNRFDKFCPHDKNIQERIFLLLVKRKHEEEYFSFKVSADFFVENKILVRKHFALCKEMYFYQLREIYGYDDFKIGLFSLYEEDSTVLLEYIDYLVETKKLHSMDQRRWLGKIWEFPNTVEFLEKAICKLNFIEVSNGSNHAACMFFTNLNTDVKDKVYSFLKRMLETYKSDPALLSIYFNIIGYCLKDRLAELIGYFLSINDDFGIFKQIKWGCEDSESWGYVLWFELQAIRLREVHIAIYSVSKPANYIPHLEYIANEIHRLEEEITNARKYDFLEDWNSIYSRTW